MAHDSRTAPQASTAQKLSLNVFQPDLGKDADEILVIQSACLKQCVPELTSYMRYAAILPGLSTGPSYFENVMRSIYHPRLASSPANLSRLPIELLDQILLHLEGSSAVAFKLTCRHMLASNPQLSHILTRPVFGSNEAFRAKAYLEDLTLYHRRLYKRWPAWRSKYLSCSACKTRHPDKDFGQVEIFKPAKIRKCLAANGIYFFDKKICFQSENDGLWRGAESTARFERLKDADGRESKSKSKVIKLKLPAVFRREARCRATSQVAPARQFSHHGVSQGVVDLSILGSGQNLALSQVQIRGHMAARATGSASLQPAQQKASSTKPTTISSQAQQILGTSLSKSSIQKRGRAHGTQGDSRDDDTRVALSQDD